MRPSDDDVFMRMALVAASRSLCDRAQVGAVIVSHDQIVISTGRNGPPRGFPHGERGCAAWCPRQSADRNGPHPDYADCPSLHAEANALLTSERSQRVGGMIYVTTEVCYGCAKMIANSTLSVVVVLQDEKARVRRSSKLSYELLQQCGVSVRFMERKALVTG